MHTHNENHLKRIYQKLPSIKHNIAYTLQLQIYNCLYTTSVISNHCVHDITKNRQEIKWITKWPKRIKPTVTTASEDKELINIKFEQHVQGRCSSLSSSGQFVHPLNSIIIEAQPAVRHKLRKNMFTAHRYTVQTHHNTPAHTEHVYPLKRHVICKVIHSIFI